MKSKIERNLALFTILVILIGLFQIMGIYPNSILEKREGSFDKMILKTSKISPKIHINDNWSDAKALGICTGEGTFSNPYVIKDLIIDGGGSGNCIFIQNSDFYFRIENCTLYNSGNYIVMTPFGAGITLLEVQNAIIFNNNCTSNAIGIYLVESESNEIKGNFVYDNDLYGILQYRNCMYNNVSGNILENNKDHGIILVYSDYNAISDNMINNNTGSGIYLYGSNYNLIIRNTIQGNDQCITEEDSRYNIFKDNIYCDYGEVVQDYNYYILFLLGTLTFVLTITNIFLNIKDKIHKSKE
ncbi:MAG: nitrous oxide reductase family maturation protein NosD [Candidatus Hermodarchaeota archaeon]